MGAHFKNYAVCISARSAACGAVKTKLPYFDCCSAPPSGTARIASSVCAGPEASASANVLSLLAASTSAKYGVAAAAASPSSTGASDPCSAAAHRSCSFGPASSADTFSAAACAAQSQGGLVTRPCIQAAQCVSGCTADTAPSVTVCKRVISHGRQKRAWRETRAAWLCLRRSTRAGSSPSRRGGGGGRKPGGLIPGAPATADTPEMSPVETQPCQADLQGRMCSTCTRAGLHLQANHPKAQIHNLLITCDWVLVCVAFNASTSPACFAVQKSKK